MGLGSHPGMWTFRSAWEVVLRMRAEALCRSGAPRLPGSVFVRWCCRVWRARVSQHNRLGGLYKPWPLCFSIFQVIPKSNQVEKLSLGLLCPSLSSRVPACPHMTWVKDWNQIKLQRRARHEHLQQRTPRVLFLEENKLKCVNTFCSLMNHLALFTYYLLVGLREGRPGAGRGTGIKNIVKFPEDMDLRFIKASWFAPYIT